VDGKGIARRAGRRLVATGEFCSAGRVRTETAICRSGSAVHIRRV
jgi:hypothetical protein